MTRCVRPVGGPVPPAGRDERGAVLILFALITLALLIMVAIAVDLGQQRASRRSVQSAADVAGLAAGFYLTGRASTPRVIDAQGACEAAINSIQTDMSGFVPQLSAADRATACAGLPDGVSVTPPLCAAGSTYPDVTITRGPYELVIHYPVTAADLAANSNSRYFAGGAGTRDGTDECARMSVSLARTNDTSFAGVIGIDETRSVASSVVKGGIERSFENVAALTLLERKNCTSLSTGGQGAVEVDFSDATNPGRIQADSAGLQPAGGGNCTTAQNEFGYVVWAAAQGNSQIKVNPTPGGDQGKIGVYSLTPSVNGRGGAEYQANPATPNGLNVIPTAGKLSSRLPADLKYNTALTSITDLHARAYANTTAGSAPAGTTTIISGAGCSQSSSLTVPGTVVYVDCPEYSVTGNGTLVDFATATHAFFTGKITVGNNATLGLPVVQRMYVRGCRGASTNCGNNVNNAYAISVAGTLYVNRSGFGTCPNITTQPAPPASLTHNITEIATLGGPIVGTGSIAFCQTFVYIGSLTSTYTAFQDTSGAPNCTATKPCPTTTTTGWVQEGYINVSGGDSALNWSAPNRTRAEPTAANPFEDLALWAESHRNSTIKGTGASQTTGVYFLPNSNVTFLGQGSQASPLNAQYMSRSLIISGQGKLYLKPNPEDAIKTESPGSISLIR